MPQYEFAANGKAMEDWEIQGLIRDVGAYFLDYAVSGDDKNYTDLNDLTNNFKDFSQF